MGIPDTLPVSWETYVKVKKQQLEVPDGDNFEFRAQSSEQLFFWDSPASALYSYA